MEFCCFYHQLAKEGPEKVSVKDVLLELRNYRMGLIQTADQLKFSYLAIAEGAKQEGLVSPDLLAGTKEQRSRKKDRQFGTLDFSRSFSIFLSSQTFQVLCCPPTTPTMTAPPRRCRRQGQSPSRCSSFCRASLLRRRRPRRPRRLEVARAKRRRTLAWSTPWLPSSPTC